MRILQPKKIVAEIEMRDGSIRALECETVTRDKMQALTDTTDNKRIKMSEMLYEQLSVIFGGKREDYFWIEDIRVVKQIIEYVTEQVKNPT